MEMEIRVPFPDQSYWIRISKSEAHESFFKKLSKWSLSELKFEICSNALSHADFSATLLSEWESKG